MELDRCFLVLGLGLGAGSLLMAAPSTGRFEGLASGGLKAVCVGTRMQAPKAVIYSFSESEKAWRPMYVDYEQTGLQMNTFMQKTVPLTRACEHMTVGCSWVGLRLACVPGPPCQQIGLTAHMATCMAPYP